MSNTFYVETNAGTYVAAQYLQVNGSYVVDPNTAKATSTPIYADSAGQTQLQNTNGYLIVPADFNINSPISLGESISGLINAGVPVYAMAYMASKFTANGAQDLQRTYDGNTDAPFTAAFTDAASFDLGLVSSYANVSLLTTLEAGGAYNHFIANGSDQTGIFDNTSVNVRSIVAGYVFGQLNQSGNTASSPQIVTNPDGSLDINFYDPSNTSALEAQYFLGLDDSSQISFYNPAQNDALIAQQFLNPDSSGSISANGQSFSYVPQNMVNLSFTSPGNAVISAIPTSASNSNAAETVNLATSGITTNVGNIGFYETLMNTQAMMDALGDITFSSPLTGFGSSNFTIYTNGTEEFTLDSDIIEFNAGSANSLSYSTGDFDFGVNSAASGYNEGITWNPTTGQAYLSLTGTGGAVTTALGQINPGDNLEVNGNTASLLNASGQTMSSTQVNSDGSQSDTTFNTTDTGTWSSEVYDYNNNGDETEVQYNNIDNDDVYDFYNPAQSEALAAQQFVYSDNSGEVCVGNYVLDYASVDVPSLSIDSTGSVTINLTTGSSNTVEFSADAITTDVGGNTFTDTVSDTNASVNSSGDVSLSIGGSTLTEAANGTTDTFVVGQDAISLEASSVNSLSVDNSVDDFGINSTASGYSESVDWNPTTGKAVLDITNNATDSTFASSLGYINPGDVLDVSGSSDALYNNSGQELNATNINSDGSQDDISYDTTGGAWATEDYVYNAAGAQTEIANTNTDGSAVDDYYNPANGDAESAQVIVNANGSGTITWGDDSASFASANGDTIQVRWDQATETIIVSGDGSLTMANGSAANIDVDNDSDLTIAASNSDIILQGTVNLTLDGGSDDVGTIAGVTDDTLSIDGSTNTVSVGDDSTIGITGLSETVDASDDTVNLGSSTGITLDGSGDSVAANTGSTSDTLTVDGNTNTVSLNGSSTVALAGTGETVDASSDTVNLGSSTSVTVDGNSDHVNANTGATADTVNVDGNTDTISVHGSSAVDARGTGETIDASSDTVNVGSNTSATIDGASDNIAANTGATGDAVSVDGNTNTVSLNGSSTVAFVGTGETADASGDTINLTANSSGVTLNGSNDDVDISSSASFDTVSANGNADTVNLYENGYISLDGLDETVNGAASYIDIAGNTSANINGGADSVLAEYNATNDTVSIDGNDELAKLNSGSILYFTGGDAQGQDEANVSNDIVYANSNTDAFVDGDNDDLIATGGATGDTLGLYGNYDTLVANGDSSLNSTGIGNAIDASGDDIEIGTYSETSLNGSHDDVTTQGSDTVYVSGQDNSVSGDDTYAQFYGNTSGDYVYGSDDTDIGGTGDGGGPGAGDGDGGDGDGGDGDDVGDGDGDGDGDGGDGYDFVKTKNVNPTALLQYDKAAIATGGNSSVSVYEDASWGQPAIGEPKVITWSFADSNTGNSSSDQFSSYITNAQEQEIVEEAIEEWEQASGIVFEEVSDSQNADIRIGFGNFETTSTGVVGYTDYTSNSGTMNSGTVVRMEDPSQLSLETGPDGQLVYDDTSATFEQVVLHELGHALGLADNIDPNSVMYYESTSVNQTLDSTDIAGIQALYGGSGSSGAATTATAAPASSQAIHLNSQWQKFVQAGASFGSEHSWVASTEGAGNFIPPYHHLSALAAGHT